MSRPRRRLGKKNEMLLNFYDYSIGLIGESGVGKTTLIYEICNKYLGEDGYIFFNIGREEGIDALPNIVYEDVKTFEDLVAMVDDIVEYKQEDYQDLKIVVWDTLDELTRLAFDYTLEEWNRDNPVKRAKSIKATHGGFMAGEDYAIGLMQEQRDRLKEVGVQVMFIAHTKVRTKSDPISGIEYDILDAKLMNRVFDEFKTKYDVIGTAYIDRDIDLEKTKDIMGKEIVKGKIEQEKRLITFRDNNYSVVCKSRFKHIKNSVRIDADEFVGAINDAIKAQYEEAGGKNLEVAQKKQAQERDAQLEEKLEAKAQVAMTEADQEAIDAKKEELVTQIAVGAKAGDRDKINKVKEILAENNITSMGDIKDAEMSVLVELAEIFE